MSVINREIAAAYLGFIATGLVLTMPIYLGLRNAYIAGTIIYLLIGAKYLINHYGADREGDN